MTEKRKKTIYTLMYQLDKFIHLDDDCIEKVG